MSALLIPIRLLSQDALGAAERRAAAVDAEAAAQAAAVQETLRELGAEVMGGFDVSQGIFEGEGSEDLMEQVAEAEAEVREPARLWRCFCGMVLTRLLSGRAQLGRVQSAVLGVHNEKSVLRW